MPIAKRFGLEPTARDHVVSFKGVRDPEELGVEGRRAHTFVVSVSGRLGI